MGARYEVYLTDDRGVRLAIIKNYAFLNYSRIVQGVAPCDLGIPLDEYLTLGILPAFQVDRRLEIWRAPGDGFPLRLERSFFLQKPKFYTRAEDAVDMVQFLGVGPNSLLDRRIIPTRSGTSQSSKTDFIDDMMKEIVSENLGASAVDEDGVYDADRDLSLTGQFSVAGDVSKGPSITKSFAFRQVIDVLKELHQLSVQKNAEDSDNQIIYFDILQPSPDQFLFSTFAGLRGQDRTTNDLTFSVQNENLEAPYFEDDHFSERNFAYGGGQGEGAARTIVTVEDEARSKASIWARREVFVDARQESTAAGVTSRASEAVAEGQPKRRLYATFKNSPGSPTAPRSLYGLDWDLGDLLPISYAGQQFEASVEVIYVSVDDQGNEKVIGRNEIGEAPQ